MADDLDVLGPDWRRRTLPLRPDLPGRPDPVATLVHRADAGTDPDRPAVLYLHGFVDYFFHDHVGAALAERGIDLYGLDLRDYGRSIRPGRTPNTVRSLGVYAEEVDTAIHLLRRRHRRVVLLGHSTGGLIAALWADARHGTGLIDALVLNSPWLDLRGTRLERTVLTGVIDVLGLVAPDLPLRRLAPHYGEAAHAEWGYDLAWKPHTDFPARASFIRAVRRGQSAVRRGLAIDVPVLVLTSDTTGPDDRWHEHLLTTDSVLDVADMWRLAPNLGEDVTVEVIEGGAHDLALSPEPARSAYLTAVAEWAERS
ncbi:alpha/beta hydrolase [Cellulomonas denverensis]|uniref:alpha/beta hydrolase n=1 Tax=Cellulomonas denverensis TaxID=264297 RepID=UPI0019420CCC|nr:alpha/beta hydrolase [Cellulomonas denverensis]GIG26213.1 alpha/beta hydrolase [Cellulomonas denverensis]